MKFAFAQSWKQVAVLGVSAAAGLAALALWPAKNHPDPSRHASGFIALTEVARELPIAELWDPSAALPQSQLYPAMELRKLYGEVLTCTISREGSPALTKVRQWHKHVCDGVPLPPDFLKNPPWMHPSGSSFAALALARSEISAAEALPFLHLTEVSRLGLLTHFSPPIRLLASLSPQDLWALRKKPAIHREELRTWIWDEKRERLWYFTPTEFRSFLRDSSLKEEKNPQADSCVIRGSTLCLAPEPSSVVSQQALLVAMTTLAVGALLAVLILAVLWLKARAQLGRDRLLMLQTVTHEIRSPVTAMRLAIEDLRNDFDQMSSRGQEGFFSMSQSLGRLSRIIDASRDYLATGTFTPGEAAGISIADFLASVCEGFPSELVVDSQADSALLTVDPFWMSICLKNLVRNAFVHGAAPVQLHVRESATTLIFEVSDAGTAPVPPLHLLTREFHKGKESQGLGLGLAIVSRIVRDMKGTLRMRTNPTRFTIEVNKG